MISTIEINQLEELPLNCLAILRDNLGIPDMFALCLKDKEELDITSLNFKIAFISDDNIPICVIMIKNNNKIYKCLIGFNIEKEFEYLKQLMNFKTFNLFLFSESSKQSIVKIDNMEGNKFIDAMLAVKSTMSYKSLQEVEEAKQKILNNYSDEQLWNDFSE